MWNEGKDQGCRLRLETKSGTCRSSTNKGGIRLRGTSQEWCPYPYLDFKTYPYLSLYPRGYYEVKAKEETACTTKGPKILKRAFCAKTPFEGL